MDARKHTEAYATSFESSFSSTVAEPIRAERIFENEQAVFSQIYKYCESFFLTDSEYAKKLSLVQRSFAEVLVRIVGSVLDCSDEIELSQTVLNRLTSKVNELIARQSNNYLGFIEVINSFLCKLLGKSISNVSIGSDDFEALVSKLTQVELKKRFVECVYNLFSDIDCCIASYVVEKKPSPSEKKTLTRDVLYAFQESLGTLWAFKDDDEANVQTRRIVKLLKAYGVDVEWPDLELQESNERFFVIIDPTIDEPRVYKPYLRSDSICLQGELSVPGKND